MNTRLSNSIVVVGASAGGLEALKALLDELPSDFECPICVVLHTSRRSDGTTGLPEVLSYASKLSVKHPQDGERLKPRWIYVAEPDYHLVIRDGHMHLVKGPKENRARPSIDPLFRSAAESYGSSVVGILLSGASDDGTAGLWEIKNRGGVTIVQSPTEALFPRMVNSALENVAIDYTLPVNEIGRLGAICKEKSGTERIPSEIAMDATTSQFICPECNGPIQLIRHGNLDEYRCRVGHSYSPQSFYEAHKDAEEHAIWAAIVLLETGADLADKLSVSQPDLKKEATGKRQLANTIRKMFVSSSGPKKLVESDSDLVAGPSR